MDAMTTEAAASLRGREVLARRLRAALDAVEADDPAGLKHALDGLLVEAERPLATGVAKLARDLQQAIRELDLDSRLACLAGGEIQDACTHLDHVVKMTEDAAHRTLDLVDDSREAVAELALRHCQLLTTADPEGGEALAQPVARLRGNLVALAQAQEYQDLSGQLIRRVTALVRNVEAALLDLLRAAGTPLKDAPAAPIPPSSKNLMGPAGANPTTQQDADALLADLGF